ncbi:ATP-binding protein [Streptomyces sp. NPDC001380]|uniref:ATP-binding protein n=1 Tax=Streptomyces sp. NPDC001380 TaxID=3364566 RepID=UPI00368ED3A2
MAERVLSTGQDGPPAPGGRTEAQDRRPRHDWLSERAVEAERQVSDAFDLGACVREPIHLLGGVQSYGTLLAVRAADGVVDSAALNTGDLLGAEAQDLVGTGAARLLGAEQWAQAREAAETDPAGGGLLPMTVTVDGCPRLFDVTVHRTDDLLVLEFEPRTAGAPFAFQDFYPGVRRALRRLQGAATAAECCRAAVREVRALTGYDRVVAYRFDGEDGPGEVVAEEIAEGREPWLGLWFPASDIPPQARRLYTRNWIRVIADVDDPTVGLHPPVRPATGQPLDLSGSVLRTVSGYHLEYLRNIGVTSSMSVSLLREGRLWGLIACHGDTPNRLSPELRAACEFFGTALSLQLAALDERSQSETLARSRSVLAGLAGRITGDLAGSLMETPGLPELAAADGVLLLRGGTAAAGGAEPPPALAPLLPRLAAGLPAGTVWCTDRLPETLAEQDRAAAGTPAPGATQDAAVHGTATAPAASAPVPPSGPAAQDGGLPAGLLLVPLTGEGDVLAWWRREWPTSRDWAADPARPVRLGPRGERLTPRGSTAVFRATVRGRSLPWTAEDRAAAHQLWRTLSDLLLRRASELSQLNEELRRINEDLNSFAHAAAHDLKEPLRGISNASAFIVEDAGPDLDAATRRRLDTVQRLAARMDGLLDSLLHFSRLGRVGLQRERTALDTLLDEALEVAGDRLAEQQVAVLRPGPLPVVSADPARLREVLVNLLVNAAKYASDTGPRTVEVAAGSAVPPGGDGPVPAVVVRDNGIGIPADQHEEVFQLFRRLHRRTERGGGSGVGLAVVRRIVERHGGVLWLESAPGEGTAVWFTLDGGAEG